MNMFGLIHGREWGGSPKLDALLYAMIQDNTSEVEYLLDNGWKLSDSDCATFQRILYYKVNNYQLIKILTEHHFNDIWFSETTYGACIDEEGYSWGLAARAYLLGAYDAMDLLLKNGFSDLYIHTSPDKLEVLLIKKNDMNAIRILIHNGYDINDLCRLAIKFNNMQLYNYLTGTPRLGRKTYALAHRKFEPIPKPVMEKGSIFSKKRREAEYYMACEDYEDRVQAQKAYFRTLSEEDWAKVKENEEISKETSRILVELMEEGWIETLNKRSGRF